MKAGTSSRKWFAAAALAWVLGCSPGTTGPKETEVGTAGGTATGSDGVKIEIPAGALTQAVKITVDTAELPAGATIEGAGKAFVFGPSGQTFSKAVKVTIPFDASKLPSGSTSADVVIYTAPDGSTDFEALPTVVAADGQVSAEVTHFSVFVPVVPAKMNNAQILGTWSMNDNGAISTLIIEEGTWRVEGAGGEGTVVQYNNAANTAVLQRPGGEQCSPGGPCTPVAGLFMKIVWTEPKNDMFYMCVVADDLETEAEAVSATGSVEWAFPTTGGCNGEPWMTLTRIP